MRKSISIPILGATVLLPLISCKAPQETEGDLPNILWLTSEDNSPFAGCYGDEFATTPNIDRLASEGFLYTHAYANAPVCAPARNTIITGIYANSGGNQHMRSEYTKSKVIRYFPEFLREAGYYCTNNSKTDYNINPEQTRNIWDESGNSAHYKNRPLGQPFFAVFNTGISHESSIHESIPAIELRHSPEQVPIPPYHPDTPDIRHDWAQYYDNIEGMDAWVGGKLKELQEAGLAENTIVFYYGDHGGVLARSKRFVYETGTRVPFIVRIPKKYRYLFPTEKPGSKVDRLISFVDLAPTILSIAGISIPEWMQGKAFLGSQKTVDPEYTYMFRGRMDERYDMSRAVRDQKFRYIRNYMPYRIYGQHLNYLWQAPSVRSWEQAYRNGKCNLLQSKFWEPKPTEELYDTENDPWEVNNLAADPSYKEVLERMRKAQKNWVTRIYDTGFIPEADLFVRADSIPFYDYLRSDEVPFQKIVDAASLATLGQKENLDQMTVFLKDDDSAVRYWGATGLLILKEDARPAIPELEEALKDSSPNVVVVAAEALYHLGKKETGVSAMLATLNNPNEFARAHALNAIDYTKENTLEIEQAVMNIYDATNKRGKEQAYDQRLICWLFEKWGIDKQTL